MVSLKAVHGPTGKLSPQDWMTAPATKAVIKALTAGGSEVRFVGGCVRDALAHRPVQDVDLATPDAPEKVMKLLAAAGIKAIPTGIGHGSVTAMVGEQKFEITTLRRDVETDGRHAKVAFTDDWMADAERRDFTINALSATIDGDVYDMHDGIADLAHGRIRFVGLAKARIGEDVLRLLRYFRFFGAYGRPPADPDAIAACRSEASKLSTLSAERVRDELLKIMMVPNPADVAVMMRGLGIFAHILPEAGDVGRLRMLVWLETRAIRIDSVQPEPLRRLAALLGTDGAGAEVAARRLKLSNRDTLHLVTLVAPPADIGPNLEEAALRRALHRLGPVTVRDLALLAWAAELAITPRIPATRTQKWIHILQACDNWKSAVFPLTGIDVMMALGLPEGPRVGELLAAVEAWWEDGDYQASRDDCLNKLKALAVAGR
ncbi:MAG: CCA tRNA nucleotidyltransferase [Rhodospirillales bacterium]|nr:CCA tRNA nucleotidyltransferase [Rhodospirillales bacterium]